MSSTPPRLLFHAAPHTPELTCPPAAPAAAAADAFALGNGRSSDRHWPSSRVPACELTPTPADAPSLRFRERPRKSLAAPRPLRVAAPKFPRHSACRTDRASSLDRRRLRPALVPSRWDRGR